MTFTTHDFQIGDTVIAAEEIKGIITRIGFDGTIEIEREDGTRIWRSCKGGRIRKVKA